MRDNDFRIVLDLGYGTLARLLSHCPDATVDALVITHEHPDHCVDASGLARVRYFDAPQAGRLPLYCPPGVLAKLRAIEPQPDPEEIFEFHELPGNYRLGRWQLTSVPLPHHVPSVGIRLSRGDLTLAYTGDTGPAPALADLGRNANLFVMEATLAGDATDDYLTSASQAGQWAARAGAKRLLLTHFWPAADRDAAAEEASEFFSGEIINADEDLVIEFDDI